MISRLPLLLAALFCAAFVALPLGLMFGQTFWSDDGLTLSAWSRMLAEPTDRTEMLWSLVLGTSSATIALVLGFGHGWLTTCTDLPGAKALGPLGLTPLVVPPILVAMGFADLVDVTGFFPTAALLGITGAPFVAVLTGHGLRSIDGRLYEAALLSRGKRAANRMLARMVAPEVAAGVLLAFVFAISDHGVPDFLTVKGKTWHTYAEGLFGRWTRRATGVEHGDLMEPIVAAVPLVLLIALALMLAMRLRGRPTVPGDFREIPVRRLGVWRWPALLMPLLYLGVGFGVPVVVMARWAMGSTSQVTPMSLANGVESVRLALRQTGGELGYTVGIAAAATVLVIAVAIPLAYRAAANARWIEVFSAVPLAVPAILLAIGFIRAYNNRPAGAVYDAIGYDFYDSWGVIAAAYSARLLPFGVLTLANAQRRVPAEIGEAAALGGRGPLARALRIHLPLLRPAAWSAACLVFVLALRELDLAAVLPSGNGTVVRRLANVVHFGGEDVGGALALLLLGTALLLPVLTMLVTGRKLRSLL